MKELIYMEKLNNWKYCKETTITHRLSITHKDCLIDINNLSKKNGAKKEVFKKEIEVLNLDCVEIKLAKNERRNRKKTMDFVVGLKRKNENKMLLIDFKLKAKNGKNIDGSNLKNKIKYSVSLIGNNPQIMKFYLLIYNKNYINEATQTIRRKMLNKPEIIIISINELKTILFN